jgi:hypothetical protein
MKKNTDYTINYRNHSDSYFDYVVRFVIKFTNKMFTSKTGKGKIMEFMKKEAEGQLPSLEKGLWKYRNLHSYL